MSTDTNLLHVIMNGEPIGDIQRSSAKNIRFRYQLANPNTFTPLSVTMLKPSLRYRGKSISNWITGLLPDRPETIRQWCRRFGIPNNSNAFDIIRHVGEDVAGAAQFVIPTRLEEVLKRSGSITELNHAEISTMLRSALADLPIFPDSNPHGKFSLAGAQAKIALHKTRQGWGTLPERFPQHIS